MQFTIELPEWAEGRNLRIFAGRENAVVYHPAEGWFVKTEQCSRCGKCCEADEDWPLGTKVLADGRRVCLHLNKSGEEWVCGAGGIAPFSCCRDNPLQLAHEECSIRYRRL